MSMFTDGNFGLNSGLGGVMGMSIATLIDSIVIEESHTKAEKAIDSQINKHERKFRSSVWGQLPESQRLTIKANEKKSVE